jgi:ATP-dependent Clp protease protease subunit
MKSTTAIALAAILASPLALAIQDNTTKKPAPAAAEKAAAPKPEAKTGGNAPADTKATKMREEQGRLALENSLATERLNRELADLRAEAQRLKAEREALTERLALETAKRKANNEKQLAKIQVDKQRLENEAGLAKVKAEKLGAELKAQQAAIGLELSKLDAEIKKSAALDKRRRFVTRKPICLKNPLKNDGILVISDRRIPLNGAITSKTADYVTTRIHYYNNLNQKLPIFIVIDDSPGGSVLAGYRILKAMDSSEAPIHVVLKSFAASMAATIVTLAEHSYALPNSMILHHQISNRFVMTSLNLTQQKEGYERAQQFWRRLAGPIAKKMGITTDELIKQMYAHDSDGDWLEFADKAQKLKWVDHVIAGVEETSLRTNPDKKTAPSKSVKAMNGLVEERDADGKPVIYLPHSNPVDVYFLFDPQGYYQLK